PTLRGIADQFQQAKGEVVAVLGARANGKAILVAGVSPAAVKRGLKAGKIIGEVAGLVGGRGGGKPAFAQAGGPNAGALGEALAQVAGIVKSALEGR
ncbi:MAG: alanine--tRNA ligase, partial [Gemmatimonadetes bacterium]|nr:alanine--tRNA ligase [Gemmatimonadota bacterium]